MNGTYQKIFLVGRLGDAPIRRYTEDGLAVANFSIATNRVVKNKNGEKEERVTWHRITCWNKLAEFASDYLTKGNRVVIEGHMENREWTDGEDMKRSAVEIIASQLTSLESKPKEQTAQAVQEEAIL